MCVARNENLRIIVERERKEKTREIKMNYLL